MTLFVINTPIWKGRKVGLAEDKMFTPLLAIQILYKNKQRKREYPHTYYIEKEKALTYPVQYLKGHKLRIIPIGDLKIEDAQI